MLALGAYLGTPVIVVEDYGDGWVTAVFPDGEPKKGQLRTYNKDERWRLWKDQVEPLREISRQQ